MLETTVTRKGQVTILAELRRKYGIREGMKMDVVDSSDGVLLKLIPDFRSLAGVDDGRYTHYDPHFKSIPGVHALWGR